MWLVLKMEKMAMTQERGCKSSLQKLEKERKQILP